MGWKISFHGNCHTPSLGCCFFLPKIICVIAILSQKTILCLLQTVPFVICVIFICIAGELFLSPSLLHCVLRFRFRSSVAHPPQQSVWSGEMCVDSRPTFTTAICYRQKQVWHRGTRITSRLLQSGPLMSVSAAPGGFLTSGPSPTRSRELWGACCLMRESWAAGTDSYSEVAWPFTVEPLCVCAGRQRMCCRCSRTIKESIKYNNGKPDS